MELERLFRGLHAVIVRVRDMAASREFFTLQLGLSPLTETPTLCVFSPGGDSVICVWQVGPGEQLAQGGVQAAYPNLLTDNADLTRAELIARGVDCTEVAHDGPVRWFSFKDPDGNRYDCCQFV
jgi:catechol 2,3-dioxygenase-like lactoylglutathione lyase family enzyme